MGHLPLFLGVGVSFGGPLERAGGASGSTSCTKSGIYSPPRILSKALSRACFEVPPCMRNLFLGLSVPQGVALNFSTRAFIRLENSALLLVPGTGMGSGCSSCGSGPGLTDGTGTS